MKRVGYILILISFLTKAGNPASIIFKENRGQWPEKVLFGTEFLNTKFYINKSSFNYCVYNYAELAKINIREREKKSIIHGHNYEVNFVGGNLNNFSKKEEQSDYYNYFLGNDKRKWASKVKGYQEVEFKDVYE